MTTGPIPIDAIRDLPEWQGARWSTLHGGLTNRTWRLQKNGREAVLKVDDEPRSAPFNSRTTEAALQSEAARAGLANPVLFADSRVYLTEYVDGTVWSTDVFDDEGNIDRLARALRRLHKLPRSGRRFDAVGAAKTYARAIAATHRNQASLCLDVIATTPLTDRLCLCHNDLVADNIVSTPEIRFLDWEYACDNEPMFDLATIIEHHALDPAQAERLLHVYTQGHEGPSRARLAEQRRLYLALWWLWLASGAGEAAGELDELDIIARRLATSCS